MYGDSLSKVFKVVEYGEYENAIDIVEGLNNDEINSKDDDIGWTLLHLAVWRGHNVLVNKLIDMGANPNAQSDRGSTPVHVAAIKGNPDIMKILLKENAVDMYLKDNMGRTALMIAMYKGFSSISKLLIDYNEHKRAEMWQ